MTIENKLSLLELTHIALRNFIVNQIALKRIEHEKALPGSIPFYDKRNKLRTSLPIKHFFIDQTSGKEAHWNSTIKNCSKSLFRAIIAETFELTKKYCQESKQMPIFEVWENYNFHLIIRNCTSHGTGGRLNKWSDKLEKKGITEVSWREIKIFKSQVGQAINMLDMRDIIVFSEELIVFINDRLI